MALFVWTATGNYPSGGGTPWAGQPLAAPPAGTFFTPNTKLPAEVLNYVLANIAENLAELYGGQQAFTSSGTWVCPAGVTEVVLEGYGGGGGGAGGCGGLAGNTSGTFAGGGAGAGAPVVRAIVPVTPGLTYTVSIGPGGNPGVPGATGSGLGGQGDHGGPTTFFQASTPLASFAGAQGGNCSKKAVASNVTVAFTPGAVGLARVHRMDPDAIQVSIVSGGFAIPLVPLTPGAGGTGTGCCPNLNGGVTLNGYDGAASPQGFQGGLGGLQGAASATGGYLGGGAGGGGGGGPAAQGGAGGTGAPGVDSGSAANGGAGTDAPVNSGAGGGGGGGGGCGVSSAGTGGNGGFGGSGFLLLTYTAAAA